MYDNSAIGCDDKVQKSTHCVLDDEWVLQVPGMYVLVVDGREGTQTVEPNSKSPAAKDPRLMRMNTVWYHLHILFGD